MRKILLTARRWDLIFDILRSLRRSRERPSKTIEKKENGRKKKKKNNTHTRNFYLLIIETHRSYTTT